MAKELKLLAGNIIKESDYSISAKKQLLKFLMYEADENQIKSLILDGTIERLEEDAIGIVNKRFDNVIDSTIKESIEDTSDFINIGREVICDILESQIEDPIQFEKSINFIINEASDYQILSMIIEETIPDELNNSQKEIHLIESLNEFSGVNFIPISEGPSVSDIASDLSTLRGRLSSLSKNPENFSPGKLKAIRNTITRKIQLKTGILNNLKQMKKTGMGAAAGSAAKLSAPSVHKPSPYWTPAQQKLPGKLNMSKMAGPGKGGGISGAVQKARGNQGAVGMAGATTGAKGALASGVAKAKELAAKGAKFATSPTGQVIGGLAAAALVSYAAYKIYKNYLSKAARSCSGSADKSTCMKQFKNKAIQAQISKLSSGMGSCAKSKNPAKCKAAIQGKIAKLKGKIRA